MNPRDLLRRFVEKEREFRSRDFLAPYTRESQKVIVKMDGLSYTFRIVKMDRKREGGLGIFHPLDPHIAEYRGEADDDMRRQYLDLLPHISLILCYQTDHGWVCYPQNLTAATKQMGIETEVLVKGVSDAEVFDVVLARYDGVHFWYDNFAPGGDAMKSAEMRGCFNPEHTENQMRREFDSLGRITPEDRSAFELTIESWKVYRKGLTEEMLKESLAIGGGRLASYVLRGDNIEVRWNSASGQSYTSVVKKETLDVVSSGICLDPHDGTGPQDHLFHLKDLPFVMTDGEHKHRIVRRHIDMQ